MEALIRELERADEGLANAYSSARDDARRNDLACERLGIQRAIEIVRAHGKVLCEACGSEGYIYRGTDPHAVPSAVCDVCKGTGLMEARLCDCERGENGKSEPNEEARLLALIQSVTV